MTQDVPETNPEARCDPRVLQWLVCPLTKTALI